MTQAIQNDIVSLDFYKPMHRALLESYHLPEEQVIFTALPLDAVAICEQDQDRHPVVVLHGNTPAGFFVLHGGNGAKEFSDNQDAILMRAYSIESSMQGMGIASKSLLLLPSFVGEHFPDKNEIILAVNHRNLHAQHLYMKCGFQDKGIRVEGPIGEMHILHLELGG